MMVFWEQKLVFLATPKTGSTALAAALESHAAISVQRPPLLKHTTVHRYHRFIGPYLQAASQKNWEVVALMREPCDWLASWYRYRRRDDPSLAERSTKGLSFEEFVAAWCAHPRPEVADVGSQERFLRPRQGLGVDRLFRYEDMAGFVQFLEGRLGVSLPVEAMNVSPPADVTLSPTGLARLRDTAAADYALYATITPAPRTPRR